MRASKILSSLTERVPILEVSRLSFTGGFTAWRCSNLQTRVGIIPCEWRRGSCSQFRARKRTYAGQRASGNPRSGRFLSATSINSASRTLLIGSRGLNRVDDIYLGAGQMEKQTFPSFSPKKRHVTAFKLFGTKEIGPYVNSWARTVHLGSCAIPSRNASDVSVSCVRELGISEERSRE